MILTLLTPLIVKFESIILIKNSYGQKEANI